MFAAATQQKLAPRPVLTRIGTVRRYRYVAWAMDMLALAAAWQIAVMLRFELNAVMPRHLTAAQITQVAPPLSAILVLWSVLAVWFRVYDRTISNSRTQQFIRITEAVVLSSTLTIVAVFVFMDVSMKVSRSFVLLFMSASFLMIMAGRYTAARIVALANRRWPYGEKVAVVGRGAELDALLESMRASGPFVCTGIILPEDAPLEGMSQRIPVLGTTRYLAELINRQQLNRIILIPDHMSRKEVDECACTAKKMGVVVSRIIGEENPSDRVELTAIEGVRLIDLKPVYFTRRQESAKRVFDVVVAAITLAIVSPLLAICAVIIKVTSPGPVLYRSLRVGRGGRHFEFLKFRSMHATARERDEALARDNLHTGHLFKIKNDPRITRFGHFMRRYSLDELPQLVNVIRGDMSLVGPRPLPAHDLDPDGQSRLFTAWAEQRSRVLPGITGPWQIGGRSTLPFAKMVELDIEYIRHWSLWVDLIVLLKTPAAAIAGKGAF